MQRHRDNNIISLWLPCVAFSMAVGFASAIVTTLFKLAAEKIIHLSAYLRGAAADKPERIILLILGFAATGFAASIILSFSRTCRGGGIPSSVAAIRGLFSFKWLASILVLPFSALLTFLCGLPLGTEGPCVQMGTAVGDGITSCCKSKKNRGWRRYIMTGGASAGFSIATGAPISAIIFSVEEIHKRLSPVLLTVCSISVISAQITAHFLAALGIGSLGLFDVGTIPAIPLDKFFAPLITGLVCGCCSILFTRLYHAIDGLMRKLLAKISIKLLFPLLFVAIGVTGFFLADALGTGHALVDSVLRTQVTWYTLVIVFLVRAVFMILSNTAGVTGGTFLPTLAFGAITGSLCAEAMIRLGWIGAEHYVLMVVLGITAFLGSTSRIPVTACVFAIEALGGMHNVLPIICATTVAMLIAQISKLEDFTDTVIKTKLDALTKDKSSAVIDVPLTVGKDAFILGKEMRDVLWPNSCVIISVKQNSPSHHGAEHISEGDVITVHYETYDPDDTAEELEILTGKQSDEISRVMRQLGV